MRNMKLAILVLVLGCGMVAGPGPADPTCNRLDEQKVAWSTVEIVGGAVGTTAGTVIPLVDKWADPQDVNDWQMSLGVMSAVGGGLSLIGGLMSGTITQEWTAAGCGGTP